MRNPRFLGVYSQKKQADRQAKGLMYFVWQLPDGNYAAQELDPAFSPRARPVAVPAAKFEKAFHHEPNILAAPVTTPDFRQLRTVAPKVAELTDDGLARLEKARLAKQVETDLRDNFAKALRALSRPRDRKGAMVALERITSATQGIVPDHKHMFRDFGVTLRKKSLPELSLQCAKRAVELSPNDDHARFNLARILGMLGKYDAAAEQIGIARKLGPKEKVYGRLARYLEQERQRKMAL